MDEWGIVICSHDTSQKQFPSSSVVNKVPTIAVKSHLVLRGEERACRMRRVCPATHQNPSSHDKSKSFDTSTFQQSYMISE